MSDELKCSSTGCRTCDKAPGGASGDLEDVIGHPKDGPSSVSSSSLLSGYHYTPMFQYDDRFTGTTWRRLDDAAILGSTASSSPSSSPLIQVHQVMGREIVEIKPSVLVALAHRCIVEIQHFFRHDHLQGWANILADPEASENDRFVAMQLLKNACIAAGKVLPSCQDTGTAIVMARRGELVWTGGEDEAHLSRGIWEAYTSHNLRYSQCAPLTMFDEDNTNNNMPAQVEVAAAAGNEYHFLFVAKGGGSANKSQLFQMTKALLNEKALRQFIREKIKAMGTAACPPYHIALVIGGTSAEHTLHTVKLASCRYYDTLPTTGDETGRAFRDEAWERIVMEEARASGIGAQFGGKYFAHQARVIRLPRHGASCPVGLGVSCSADRQILAKITKEGVFYEALVHDPARYLPAVLPQQLSGADVVRVDLRQPMAAIRALLTNYPIKTRLSLTGRLTVGRDIAHARLKDMLDQGLPLPSYVRDNMIYYAGPAKTPEGLASGSFGPTTAGRMDSYVGPFMAAGGSFITLAKGNRSAEVTKACKQYGGFYLGSIGGPAALLALENIRHVEVAAFPELGMEAVWLIDVEDFPAFIVVDDKGNDFFQGMV